MQWYSSNYPNFRCKIDSLFYLRIKKNGKAFEIEIKFLKISF